MNRRRIRAVVVSVAAACVAGLPAAGVRGQSGDEGAEESRVRLRAEVASARQGSRAHQDALRRLLERELEWGAASAADSLLSVFSSAYGTDHPLPTARMVVRLSRAWMALGTSERAESTLERPALSRDRGARALLDARRAVLALQAGDPDRAIALLRGPAGTAGVDPAERAGWIALLGALETAGEEEGRAFGSALRAVESTSAGEAGAAERAAALAALAAAPRSPARPAFLGLLARALDESHRAEEVDVVRRRLVERHPDAPEAAAALLALGGRAVEAGDPTAARSWLETLVLRHPESPSAPEARRLLAGLDEGAP